MILSLLSLFFIFHNIHSSILKLINFKSNFFPIMPCTIWQIQLSVQISFNSSSLVMTGVCLQCCYLLAPCWGNIQNCSAQHFTLVWSMNSGRISKFMIQRAFGEIWKVEGLPIAAMLPVEIKGNEIHLKSRERCWRKIKYIKLWIEHSINGIKWNHLSQNGDGNGNFWPVLAF